MKTINRILTLFMALTILLCSVATLTSYAANDNQSDSESEIEELQPVIASVCDHYGRTNWESIEDACNEYLGQYWTYNEENGTWSGNGYTIHATVNPYATYNYYFTFSNGSKMYFGVH